jgi:glucose-6-phosphate dehydrogenase assembly protein OpcA
VTAAKDRNEEVWRERDTTPSKIEAALRKLLIERYHDEDAFVPARVLNLVVVVDGEFRGEVENRLERVGRYHPSRLVLCSVQPRRTTIDAWCSVAAEKTEGPFSLGRETVELEIGERHLKALDTIVDALLVPDLATLVWAPHAHAQAVDSLRRLAQVVLIDSQDEPELPSALARAEDLLENAYVVDLAWLRSTPWRERVAAAFDPAPLRRGLSDISGVTVRHRSDSAAAAVLFCGWLCSRLGWRPGSLSQGGGYRRGSARARRGEVSLRLDQVEQPGAPGLAGVTIEMASGGSVSLDRAPGGLRSVRRARDGSEQLWTVLGASRGEAGILGEGVRQALLRDPTYKPALSAAREMVA